MRVVQQADAQGFLAASAGFRAAHPVLTNVIGSVAGRVRDGRRYDSELWLTVHDGHGSQPVGIAMRTAPHNLVVSPMPTGAAQALGVHLAAVDPDLPGVTGEPGVCEPLLEVLGATDRAHIGMVEKVRVLQTLTAPLHHVQGRARRIEAGDVELVADWLVSFAVEADLNVRPSRDEVLAELASNPAPARWLWMRAGQPVALAGHAPLVPTPAGTVGRVGPVYTPEQHRGHGYASAITHAVSETLRQRCGVVMLYTDAANATSNAVYERLGYAVVAEVVEIQVEPR